MITESQRQEFRAIALRHRGILDVLPERDGFFAGSREPKIRAEAIKGVVALLTKNARDPERIGRRVLVLEWLLQDEEKIKSDSQKLLAQSLGVTEGRVSQLVSAVEDALTKIKNGGEEKS